MVYNWHVDLGWRVTGKGEDVIELIERNTAPAIDGLPLPLSTTHHHQHRRPRRMGSVLSSCCGSRKTKKGSGEREPLLPTHRDETVDAVVPTQQSLNKVADLLAALANGKLPSQDQLNHLIRRILASPIFLEINKDKHDALSRRGQLVLRDVQEVLQAFMELGLEKNGRPG